MSEIYDDYPYRNKIYNSDDKIKIFNNLKQYNLCIIRSPSNIPPKTNILMPNVFFLYKMRGYYYMPFKYTDFENVQILSDMFNDNCRSKCSFGDALSPFEYYKMNKQLLISALRMKNMEINDRNMREEIYFHTIECSIHNPGIIKTFIDEYNAKKILDISCGWGDRLLGSMAAKNGIELYEGTDPNTCLHTNYNDMIKLLNNYTNNKNAQYKISCSGFETYNIDNTNYYDLVYTSPPYFDYEKYTTESTQSYNKYNTENIWFESFLQVSILKCINALKFNGHLVLYFSQEKGKTYMEKFLEWMKYVENIYYFGCIYYSNENFKGTHPIFIYKKSKSIPHTLYNPKIIVEKYKNNNKSYNIIKDDYIIGGSYTRGFVNYIKNILENNKNIKTLIYYGTLCGCEELCISYSLYLLKRENIELIFISTEKYNDEIKKNQNLSLFYHKNIKYIFKKNRDDIKNTLKLYTNENYYIIPKNMDNFAYIDELFSSLYMRKNKLVDIKVLWLIIPSNALLYALLKIMPHTKFNVVNIKKNNILKDTYNSNSNVKIYNSSYNLYDKYNSTLRYNTMLSTEGKVWEFINKKGESGDYIWNAFGIHN
jgi:hypothetical protein